MGTPGVELPPEVTDEKIYEDLLTYQDAGMLTFVLPSDPLGEEWNVSYDGRILKFLTKEGVVGFLTGIAVCAEFVLRKQKEARRPFWEQPGWNRPE